jgi:hypothetical protein
MSRMTVRIGGDSRGFRNATKDVRSEARKTGMDVAKSLAGPIAGALSIAGATAAFKSAMASAIEAGDAIDKGRQKIGVGSAAYQRLSEMAKLAGTEIDRMQPAFARMARVITTAADGSDVSQRALRRLGLELVDLQGKSPDRQFAIIANRLAMITDETQKAAAAQELFGRAAVDMMPLINQYAALERQVADMAIMTDEAVAASARYKDAMERTGRSITNSLANSGLVEYIAGVAEYYETLIDHSRHFSAANATAAEKSADKWKTAANEILDFVGKTGLAGKALRALFPEFQTSGATVAADPDFSAKMQAEKAARNEAEAAAEAAREKVRAEQESVAALEEQARLEAEAAKLAAVAAREAERAEAIRERERAAAEQLVSDLGQQLLVQRMIVDGKAREAAIEDAIYRARKRSAEITEDQLANVAAMAGELFDLQNMPGADAAVRADRPSRSMEQQTSQLERIGAIIGGRSGDDPVRQLQRQSVQIARDQLAIQKQILDKTAAESLMNV